MKVHLVLKLMIKILEDKDLLKDISNNKLYVENEAKTGKVKIHLKGNA